MRDAEALSPLCPSPWAFLKNEERSPCRRRPLRHGAVPRAQSRVGFGGGFCGFYQSVVVTENFFESATPW